MTAGRRFLRSTDVDRFQSVGLAEHQWETWWRQRGFRDTAGSTNIATPNHVAVAVWSADKSDVGGISVFDLSAQIVRLKGATVLLGLVYVTHALENPRRNVAAGESHQEQHLVVHMRGGLGHAFLRR